MVPPMPPLQKHTRSPGFTAVTAVADRLHHAHAVMAQHEGLVAGQIAAKLAEEHVGGIERCGPAAPPARHAVRAAMASSTS